MTWINVIHEICHDCNMRRRAEDIEEELFVQLLFVSLSFSYICMYYYTFGDSNIDTTD